MNKTYKKYYAVLETNPCLETVTKTKVKDGYIVGPHLSPHLHLETRPTGSVLLSTSGGIYAKADLVHLAVTLTEIADAMED